MIVLHIIKVIFFNRFLYRKVLIHICIKNGTFANKQKTHHVNVFKMLNITFLSQRLTSYANYLGSFDCRGHTTQRKTTDRYVITAFSFIYKMINNSFSEKVHFGVYLWIYLCQISSIGYVKVEISDIINCESLYQLQHY